MKVKGICVVFLILLISGCQPRERPQWERLGTVTTFSRARKIVQPFKTRPTAEQLHARTVKQQMAFRTIASSSSTVLHDYGRSGPDKAGVWHTVDRVETCRQELREIRPDKWLLFTGGKNPGMGIRNGRRHLLLWSAENEFSAYTRSAAEERELRQPCRYLEPARRPYKSLRLLPDERLNGCDVYVLRIELPELKVGAGIIPREVCIVYLGKNDLLPRRWHCLDFEPGRARRGHPHSLSILTFSGYRADFPISPELFDTRPPKGAKQSGKTLVGR